jgi:peptidoglycan hydrolase CwlO-like protein
MTSKLTITSCLVLVLFALDCSAQKLADIARQERERQKRLHSTIVVVGTTTSTIASTSKTAAAAKPPSATAAPIGPLDNQGHDEKYWRAKFDNARAALKKAQDNAQILDLKIKDLNTQMLRQSDIYNREYRLGPQITDTQKQLDDANKQVDDARQKLAGLEDELRHAGGPPGWSR